MYFSDRKPTVSLITSGYAVDGS